MERCYVLETYNLVSWSIRKWLKKEQQLKQPVTKLSIYLVTGTKKKLKENKILIHTFFYRFCYPNNEKTHAHSNKKTTKIWVPSCSNLSSTSKWPWSFNYIFHQIVDKQAIKFKVIETHVVDCTLQILSSSISKKDQQEGTTQNMNISCVVL